MLTIEQLGQLAHQAAISTPSGSSAHPDPDLGDESWEDIAPEDRAAFRAIADAVAMAVRATEVEPVKAERDLFKEAIEMFADSRWLDGKGGMDCLRAARETLERAKKAGGG